MYNFTDVREKEQVKRKKHSKQKKMSELRVEEEVVQEQKAIKAVHSRENVEVYEDDETGLLEDAETIYKTVAATDIPENKIEVVPASEVTHIIPDRKADEIRANLKIDANYPLVSASQDAEEREEVLQVKEQAKVLVKPSISEKESLEITEIEVSSSVDEYSSERVNANITAVKNVIPVEGLVTTEILPDMDLTDLQKLESHFGSAKPSVTLKDALNVSEQIASLKEEPFENTAVKKSTAAVSVSPLVGLTVLEVNDELREYDIDNKTAEKTATSKLNFNLHESLTVGEVFVEDKSGRYYPELIVPTETARKDVLTSNQILTEIHDVQEKEGLLQALKLPPAQEANVDVTIKDSLQVSLEETHEKEGEWLKKELPAMVNVGKDLTLHTSLNTSIVSSHVKEADFITEPLPSKKANIGVSEHQHKFNIETEIHESETSLEEARAILGTHADVKISLLDKNITEEVHINESEKDLIVKDDKHTAVAEVDVGAVEPIMTYETTQMASIGELKLQDKVQDESATETVITASAKIITAPLIHEQETSEDYLTKKSETITQSVVPNIPLTVYETESSESENKLTLNKIPELLSTKPSHTHHLKTPLSEEINTADQINFIPLTSNVTEKASEIYRDLHKEITVLQTTVQEQLDKLDENQTQHSKAVPSFIENESLNITEIVSSVTENNFVPDQAKLDVFAKADIESNHKIAITSETLPREALDKMESLAPSYEAANIKSDILSSVQVSQNEVLDSQSNLQETIKPDLKSIVPEIIPSQELNVSEVYQNEKESEYTSNNLLEIHSSPTQVLSLRSVAISSELVPDSSVGFTNEDNFSSKSKKAVVENVAHNEIQVTSTDYNEKESSLEKLPIPNTVSATMSIDSTQAILVEENKPELAASEFEKASGLAWAKAKQGRVPQEAITQQETMVHMSEGTLISEETETKAKSSVSLTTLQVPEYDENVTIESENLLALSTAPDKQSANISFTSRHGIQISETLSQSENLQNTGTLDLGLKTASPKIDEIYGKAAHVEEVTVNQQPEEFQNEKISVKQTDITPVPSYNLEQTEIITAETESLLPQQTTITANIEPDFTETQALIMSCTETIDKEQEFVGKFLVPTQDASVGFVPLISTINTEVLSTDDVEKLQEKSPETSQATMTSDNIRKHLQGIEVLHAEKESDLAPFQKESGQTAHEKYVEISAKEISEIDVNEKETELTKMLDMFTTKAKPSIDEQQSFFSTEVIVNQETEDLHVSGTTMLNALTTHGMKEAIQNLEPFVGEAEDTFSKTSPAKTELIKPTVEGKQCAGVSEVMLSEKEQNFQVDEITPNKKTIQPTDSITLHSSFGVDETVPIEAETILAPSSELKHKAGLTVLPEDYLNVTETTVIENEQVLQAAQTPKSASYNINLDAHRHLNVEVCQFTEAEESIKKVEQIASKEILDFSIEPVRPIYITETEAEERHEELIPDKKVKQVSPNVNLEVGDHIDVTETLVLEQDDDLKLGMLNKMEQGKSNVETVKHITVTETEVRENDYPLENTLNTMSKHSDISYEAKLPIQVQEVMLKESELDFPEGIKPREEKVDFSIESQQHVTVTDAIIQENETSIQPVQIPKGGENQMKLEALHHVTTNETTVIEEGTEFSGSRPVKDETAQESQPVAEALYSEQTQAIESVGTFKTTFKPEVSTAEEDIIGMKSIEQTETLTEEIPDAFDKYHPKGEQAQTVQTTKKEILLSQPEILESTSDLSTKYEAETSQVQFELELHKSYMTTENSAEEFPDIIKSKEEQARYAEKQITEMKSLEQTVVVAGEKSETFEKFVHGKNEKALPSQNVLQELSSSEPAIFENVTDLPSSVQVEQSKALPDLETHKSYIVTDNVVQEGSEDIIVEGSKISSIVGQVLEMKPLQQTEIFVDENTATITTFKQEEKHITGTPILNESVTLTDVTVQEMGTETSFDKPVSVETASLSLNTTQGITVSEVSQEDSPENFVPHKGKLVQAEKTVAPLSHIQCTENIPEAHVDEFTAQVTQSKTSTVVANELAPLIVTDNTCLLQEDDLKITQPKTQQVRQSLTTANELEVTDEFINEHVPSFAGETLDLSKQGKLTQTSDTEHTLTISEQETRYLGM